MRHTPIFLALPLTLACGGSGAPPADHAAGHPGAEGHAHGHGHGEHGHGHGHGDHGHHHGQGHQHDFSDVERFARIFDDPERDAWQRPAHVVEQLALRPGMTVVDLGAGTGYFLPHLAAAVGPTGCVIALDTEPGMVAHMEARIRAAGWDNVIARTVAPDDPGLEPGIVDRILTVDTWHHVSDRVAYAGRLRSALAPEGQVHVVDFTHDSPQGPPPAMRITPESVQADLTGAGLGAAVREEQLPYQYLVVGALPAGAGGTPAATRSPCLRE